MKISFLKMHGAANDFVVIDHRRPFLPGDLGPLVRSMCDRRRGVGADGLLLLEASPNQDFTMSYWNSDGHAADFCGNGARCLARHALDLGLGREGRVRFTTDAGVMEARQDPEGGGIELTFGHVGTPGEPQELSAGGRSFRGRLVRPGVPHFVVPVERVEWVPVKEWGAALRHHPAFEPTGANVDFVARLGPRRVAMRTYERGVEDETMACGSGAMAAALCAAADGESAPVAVMTAGGDVLQVGLEAEDGGQRVTLTGPAEVSFRGEWTEGA